MRQSIALCLLAFAPLLSLPADDKLGDKVFMKADVCGFSIGERKLL